MLKMMISEVSPGAAGEDEGMWQGEVCVVFSPGHSATSGAGVCPGRFVLVSAEQFCAPGHRDEVWVGGCATQQPAPHLVGDHEMSLQVQSKPQKPLNLQSI